MRHFILLLVASMYSLIALSQIEGSTSEKDDKTPTNKEYISSASFRKKVKQVFGQLATGQSTTGVLANYADLDIANGKLGFNGATALTDWCFVSLNANAKIKNSVSQIFEGFKLNSNAGVDLRIHLNLSPTFFFTEKDAIELRRAKDLEKLKNGIDDISAGIDTATTIAFIGLKDREISIVHSMLTKIRDSVSTNKEPASLNDQISRLYRLTLDSLELAKACDSANHVYSDTTRYKRQIIANKKKYEDEAEKLELAAPWQSMHLFWLTIRGNTARQRFYLYDSLTLLDQQVREKDFISLYGGLELSYYYWNKKMSIYANVGGGFQKDNNLDSLDSYEIVDTREDESGPNTRKFTNKYNAYTGTFNDFTSWKMYMNFYIFSKGNKSAMHVFSDVRFWQDKTKIFNAGLGLVLSFKSKKDEKTTINAEPYIQWNDLGNEFNSGKSGFSRNTIGIRIGLPISPI